MTAKTILKAEYLFEIGQPGAFFDYMTRPGAGYYLVPSAQDGSHVYWYDYVTDGNVQLSPALKGVLLSPVYDNPFVDESLANYGTPDPAKFTLCEAPPLRKQCLFMFDGTPNVQTSITSTITLPAAPYIYLYLRRPISPPDGQLVSALKWQFSFGGGYMLEWTAQYNPVLYHDGTAISHFVISPEERMAFFYAKDTIFQITNVMSTLQIASSAFGGTWVIQNTGELPAAVYGLSGFGGQWISNVSALAMVTSGYCISPWIDFQYNFDDADLIADVFPPSSKQAPGTAATVTIEASSGTMKQFRITLTGDGAHSPLIQGVSLKFPPAFGSPNPRVSYDFTPCIDWQQSPPQEDFGLDFVARQVSLDVLPDIHVTGAVYSFYELISLCNGQVPFRYSIGYRYTDDTTTTVQRMTGFLSFRENPIQIGDLNRLRLRGKDRWKELQEHTLSAPPCLQAMSVFAAIQEIASYAGVNPSDVIYDHTGTDPNSIYLDDPGNEYVNPPWLPQVGAKAADVIRHICQTKGFFASFTPAGQLYVTGNRFYAGLQGAYTILPTTDPAAALTKLQIRYDHEGIVNGVMGEGIGPDGQRIRYSLVDWPSITDIDSPNYIGYPAIDYISIPDCLTAASVEQAVTARYNERRAGFPWYELTGDYHSNLWQIQPTMQIAVEDQEGHSHYLLVIQMRQTLGLKYMEPTIVGEDRSI